MAAALARRRSPGPISSFRCYCLVVRPTRSDDIYHFRLRYLYFTYKILVDDFSRQYKITSLLTGEKHAHIIWHIYIRSSGMDIGGVRKEGTARKFIAANSVVLLFSTNIHKCLDVYLPRFGK